MRIITEKITVFTAAWKTALRPYFVAIILLTYKRGFIFYPIARINKHPSVSLAVDFLGNFFHRFNIFFNDRGTAFNLYFPKLFFCAVQ